LSSIVFFGPGLIFIKFLLCLPWDEAGGDLKCNFNPVLY